MNLPVASRAKRGFTLIEIAIALAVSVMLATLSVGATATFLRSQQLRTTTSQLSSSLRSAATRAFRADGDTSHGVHITATNFTLFRGTSWAARVTAYDETITFPSYIVITGATDIIFAKHTAVPSYSGNLTISNGARSTLITIYATGAVSQ